VEPDSIRKLDAEDVAVEIDGQKVSSWCAVLAIAPEGQVLSVIMSRKAF